MTICSLFMFCHLHRKYNVFYFHPLVGKEKTFILSLSILSCLVTLTIFPPFLPGPLCSAHLLTCSASVIRQPVFKPAFNTCSLTVCCSISWFPSCRCYTDVVCYGLLCHLFEDFALFVFHVLPGSLVCSSAALVSIQTMIFNHAQVYSPEHLIFSC